MATPSDVPCELSRGRPPALCSAKRRKLREQPAQTALGLARSEGGSHRETTTHGARRCASTKCQGVNARALLRAMPIGGALVLALWIVVVRWWPQMLSLFEGASVAQLVMIFICFAIALVGILTQLLGGLLTRAGSPSTLDIRFTPPMD